MVYDFFNGTPSGAAWRGVADIGVEIFQVK
jgi:hypothetical protein